MDWVDEPARGGAARPRVGARRTDRRRRAPSAEGLEGRRLPAATLPDIAMITATTDDSRSVTVDYTITGAAVDQPIVFSVERSADGVHHADDPLVGAPEILPPGPGGTGGTLDGAGKSATALGEHVVTLPIPGGIPTDPMQPFVVVTADPLGAIAESNEANNVAEFRKYTLAVVTHGGMQDHSYNLTGPPWERRMAIQLKDVGFDQVIPFNWVADSHNAGAASRQSVRLVAQIEQALAQLPPDAPVDIQFIGHSEGAVVNSQALIRLNSAGLPPQLQAGYITMTMLDPHAANNAVPGQQYSVSNGILGYFARKTINAYQSKAVDPPVIVPSNVDDAQVFYQHTPVSKAGGSNDGIYNLWGQVPVHGVAQYYDLTHEGVSHAGKFGVQDWYRLNIVPTLGNGAGYLSTIAVSGEQVPGSSHYSAQGVPLPGHEQTATYVGTAAPDSNVRLFAGRAMTKRVVQVGHVVAGADGSWTIITRPLHAGRYRVVVSTDVPRQDAPTARPMFARPTSWLGGLKLDPLWYPPAS